MNRINEKDTRSRPLYNVSSWEIFLPEVAFHAIVTLYRNDIIKAERRNEI